MNWTLLQQLLLFAITNSAITVAFIQKTKSRCKNKNHVPCYSFIANMVLGFLFTYTFTDLQLYYGFWIGLFSYIGADAIYKALEGKISSYQELAVPKNIIEELKTEFSTPETTTSENLETNTEEKVIGEIKYD